MAKSKRIKKAWSPNGYIFGALRKVWRWSPARKQALETSKHPDKDEYGCNDCKEYFDRKGVAIDHKEPVINPSEGFKSWDTYITRLFCPPDGLQVLCSPCHKVKTQAENKIRRILKNAK